MTQKKSGLSAASIVIGAVLGLCVLSGVVVAVLGNASYREWVLFSKTVEATANVSNLYRLSASYYASEQWQPGGGAALTACTVGPAATPNVPGVRQTALDAAALPESFTDLGWSPHDPIYYRYEIAGAPGACGHVAGEALYTFTAVGDLDGDGAQSRYRLGVRSDVNNELERDSSLDIEDELE